MKMKSVVLPLLILVLTAACGGGETKTATYAGAPVIVISVDTLRADHLPAYGYAGVATPAIDALRKDSILFTNAYSHVPLTLPSHVSMLTGLTPERHKVRNNIGYRLDPAVMTIPKMLKPEGYESGAAVSAYVLRSSTGISESFDFYDDGIVSRTNVAIGALQRAGADTSAVAKQWIAGRKEKPLFFLLHLFEPHSPYEPPEPFRSRFSLPYDGEIAHADQIVGDFIEALKQDGIYDKALIVFMSDHGEGLNQHGEPEHGIFLYREDIHVPLMVKLPTGARGGETAEQPVGLIDVLPTIAEVTGVKAPAGIQGRSLLHHDAASASRRIYSETLYPRIHLGWSELRSLVDSSFHFIQAPRPELYDVKNDPAETKNILADNRRVYASMRDELAGFGSDVEVPVSIDPEEAKKLAALGYLGSSAGATSGPLPDPKDGMPEIAAMMHAMKAAHEGDHGQAVAELRQIVQKNPRLSDAWNQLGMSLETMERYDEAEVAYKKAIDVTPSLAGEFGLRLANVYLRLNQLDKAAEHARLGEKINYGGAHLLLARIELEKKQFARAEEEARLATRDTHNDIQAKVLLARIYGQQDKPREALALAQEAAEEAKKRDAGAVEGLHFVVGDALARMQDYTRAEQALREETRLFPRNRQAYASLYLIYVLTNRFAEANAALEEMVRVNPSRGAMQFAAETADAVGDTRAAAQWRSRAGR
jgi:arylsulfatase A-like enzyme/Flp pilus assembly protein TadD